MFEFFVSLVDADTDAIVWEAFVDVPSGDIIHDGFPDVQAIRMALVTVEPAHCTRALVQLIDGGMVGEFTYFRQWNFQHFHFPKWYREQEAMSEAEAVVAYAKWEEENLHS